MMRRSPIPIVLRVAVGMLVLRWVLGMHHCGKGSVGWEQAHRRWHEHHGRSHFGREPRSVDTDIESPARDV